METKYQDYESKIIDGKAIASEIDQNTRKLLTEIPAKPKLAIIVANDDAATRTWVKVKQTKATALGIEANVIEIPADASPESIIALIDDFNGDDDYQGILVQMPLFQHLEPSRAAILTRISRRKDVDGLSPTTLGFNAFGDEEISSATSLACMYSIVYALNKTINLSDLDLAGKHVVIVNHSTLIGRPLSQILLNHNATVTIAHEHTANLSELTTAADIIVSATGQIGLLDAAYVKTGAMVIDVTSVKDGDTFKGDFLVNKQLLEKVGSISPVPGGIGPITVSVLFNNLAKLAARRYGQ